MVLAMALWCDAVIAFGKTATPVPSTWLVPVAAIPFVAGRGDVFCQIAVFFSKMAVPSFGGAYAVLAYVAQRAIKAHH